MDTGILQPKTNLIGQTFGRLSVVEFVHRNKHNRVVWRCLCECGETRDVLVSQLTSGKTKSCGCLQREVVGDSNRTHGLSNKIPEYNVWVKMLSRCRNPKDKAWPNYGGRGITVSEDWHEFESFIRDMGRRPSPAHSLERESNDLGYSKENCSWQTRTVQNRNKRSNALIAYKGGFVCRAELAEIMETTEKTLRYWIAKGWTTDQPTPWKNKKSVISDALIVDSVLLS